MNLQEEKTESKQVTSCLMLVIPHLQLLVISRETDKSFIGFSTQNVFLQRLVFKDKSSETLFSIT